MGVAGWANLDGKADFLGQEPVRPIAHAKLAGVIVAPGENLKVVRIKTTKACEFEAKEGRMVHLALRSNGKRLVVADGDLADGRQGNLHGDLADLERLLVAQLTLLVLPARPDGVVLCSG